MRNSVHAALSDRAKFPLVCTTACRRCTMHAHLVVHVARVLGNLLSGRMALSSALRASVRAHLLTIRVSARAVCVLCRRRRSCRTPWPVRDHPRYRTSGAVAHAPFADALDAVALKAAQRSLGRPPPSPARVRFLLELAPAFWHLACRLLLVLERPGAFREHGGIPSRSLVRGLAQQPSWPRHTRLSRSPPADPPSARVHLLLDVELGPLRLPRRALISELASAACRPVPDGCRFGGQAACCRRPSASTLAAAGRSLVARAAAPRSGGRCLPIAFRGGGQRSAGACRIVWLALLAARRLEQAHGSPLRTFADR